MIIGSFIRRPAVAVPALLLLFFSVTAGTVSAEKLSGNANSEQSNLSASIIIVGPGDPIYTYWGHIGIAIEDSETGEDNFYDFGNFSFYSKNFFKDFILGRMLYLGMKAPTELFLNYHLTLNRNLTVYPLYMGNAELQRMQERLEWWVRPENQEYLYDYYYQNCSTIIRDVLDEAIGGALREATENTMTPYTFRFLSRTGAHESFSSELLLNYLLGPAQDSLITEWEWMFLPQAVIDIGREFSYTGEDGQQRTLVGSPHSLKTANRPPVPKRPRKSWPILLLAGLLSAVLWSVLRRLRAGNCFWTTVGSLTRGLIVLFTGVFGFILGFMMIFTDHAAAYSNLNLGFSLPTVLAGLVPLFRLRRKDAVSRRRAEICLSWIWTLNLAGLAVVIILRLTGLSIQNCFSFWLLSFPLVWTASRPGLWLEEKIFGEI